MNHEIKNILIDFVDSLDIYVNKIYNQLEEKNNDLENNDLGFITIEIKNALKDFESVLKTKISKEEFVFEKKFINKIVIINCIIFKAHIK